MINPADLRQKAADKRREDRKFFDRLKKDKPRELDAVTHRLHDEVFSRIDCLTCANCCKTTSPLFRQKDITRLAAHFRIRPAVFTEKYLHIDEDNDYVLNETPCPFLGTDNYCSVYEARPDACREYPHTSQRKIHTVLKETFNNIAICPAVFEIVERLKKEI
jgi:Fe-S-cluster containining protein